MNDMNLSVLTSAQVSMTSREIAELTGKRHDNVMADIRSMLTELHGEGDLLKFQEVYTDAGGRTYPCFALPKHETMVLVTGYSAALRSKVITRIDELEAQVRALVPNFSDPVAAARAWADQYEARKAAETTKAQIGHRREATAMNTASVAVKKAAKLEIELDKAKQYATVKRMEKLYHGQAFKWRLLKDAAAQMNMPPIDVFDANYGTVKAYHADVWMEAYALEISVE